MKYFWKIDDFDSKVFGFRVAKIETIELGSEKDLIKDLVKNKIKYATYRVQSNNFHIVRALEKSGFILVDGLITFGINSSETEIEKIAKEVREANKNDIGKLKNLTSGLYSNTRVFNDPLISEEKANAFYIKWIENSVVGEAADSVLIWEENTNILGYITLQKKGQIPLIGVSKRARGKGIGKSLINASLDKFKEWGVETVEIETQMSNVAALRVYQDCGFKIIDSFITLRWAKDD